MNLFGRSFVGYLWVWAEDVLFGETGRTFLEAWELFWSSLRSLRTFGGHCVLLCATLLRRRVTELSNLCGLAQVRAVKKNRCAASCVFAVSATPAMQSEDRCRQVPRLPRKQPRDHDVNWEPSTPPEPAQRHKCHACHAKWRSMSPSATPATQSEGQ